MPGKNIHVVPTHNGWAVEAEGRSGNQQRFTSMAHAIATGTEKARRAKVELLIHGKDHQIMERNSFGNAAADAHG
ncbi:DUF2188 domain-containing protein [Cupriavidus taiwanensis]|uniref:DUF2188 domain-containing protein n=1 Tax=Cupriavidus taiwanensis TaxID=164546 RepID=A0A375HLN5_9BURK|nr:DUF2188 domain-containing protein [Cupriavidus taiwanensis]SOY66222.1 conserved hypothetical protein [Cupriavidus taiwanensis]SOY66223.1 conserved hypothetical protein [Cupriavidus taiwanensis]SOY94280.1 conserved hypothetical protein [Cupriavidus taiwanensis]SOZ27883.1 conserved hypothetical protein [Cupriavidus taiwanensis]SOZ70425.1 conserved hypothetical protein [Cupriavidus taiwanensis]